MTDVLVRLAEVHERGHLEGLQWRASLNNDNDRVALLANPDAIALPVEQIVEGRVFVAEREGVILGFAAVLPRTDGNGELDALFVEPACWRQGVGRALVEHCALVSKRAAAASLHVVGNPHAEQFYLSCGFQTYGTEQTRFGVGLLMRRSLC